MKAISVIIFISLLSNANAQTSHQLDSAQTLQEVIVKAYEINRKLIDVPAAVSVIGKAELNRYNNTNILPALNANPGVRMEERSPGSYRLSVRGSSLRSPFGVRNVKVYYNDIPFTDAGGNTYLNQLGFYNIQSIEILKGPGSSLYGAGTGGVVLVRNDVNEFNAGASLNYVAGSFGLQNINANLRFGKDDHQNKINFQRQTSSGYREHTQLRRDIFTYDAILKSNENRRLTAHFLFGDLYYQTPGALTRSEYNVNAQSSRPPTGFAPGAVQAAAAIFQKTFLAGFTYTQLFTSNLKNITTIYGAYSQVKNPAIRNYERRQEPHTGGRTLLQYSIQLPRAKFSIHAGAEVQKGFANVKVYKNNMGNPDSLQTDDEINNLQAFIFTQASLELAKGWMFTAGASLNKSNLKLTRLSLVPYITQKRNYNNQLAPRIAILKRVSSAVSLFASVSKGFSPPTTAEVLPSTGIINTNLEAENGINYEVGTRGNFLNNKFYFDITIFFFHLKNAITQRRDATGADFFVNAGSAKQNGIENYLSWQLTDNREKFISNVKFWLSYTWNNFHYNQFKQLNNDYSGNKIPGIPAHTLFAGADIVSRSGIYANLTYNYNNKIALNDANTDYTTSYNLLSVRIGDKNILPKKTGLEIFAGADNIFDVKYSLGNDINAAGGRYYNAAAGRNYFAGISLTLPTAKCNTKN